MMPLSGSCWADRLRALNVDVVVVLMLEFSLRVRVVSAHAECVHGDRASACFDTTIFVAFVGARNAAVTNARII